MVLIFESYNFKEFISNYFPGFVIVFHKKSEYFVIVPLNLDSMVQNSTTKRKKHENRG
jgi:hypothetical protein